MDKGRLNRMAALLRAVNHDTRFKMLEYINSAGDDGVAVGLIQDHMQMGQSITSQHLAILRSTGIVKTHKTGTFIIYTIDRELMRDLYDALKKIDR